MGIDSPAGTNGWLEKSPYRTGSSKHRPAHIKNLFFCWIGKRLPFESDITRSWKCIRWRAMFIWNFTFRIWNPSAFWFCCPLMAQFKTDEEWRSISVYAQHGFWLNNFQTGFHYFIGQGIGNLKIYTFFILGSFFRMNSTYSPAIRTAGSTHWVKGGEIFWKSDEKSAVNGFKQPRK